MKKTKLTSPSFTVNHNSRALDLLAERIQWLKTQIPLLTEVYKSDKLKRVDKKLYIHMDIQVKSAKRNGGKKL